MILLESHTRVVVESAWVAEALARRFPGWAIDSPPLLWEDLLEWDEAPLNPAQRLEELTHSLLEKERDQNAFILLAIETLREAGMWGATEVEFVFGVLEPTPKNRRLKELVLIYLDGPLGADRTRATQKMVESLRDGRISLRRGNHWWFVPGNNPCPLFHELAQAFPSAQGCQETGIRPLEDFFKKRKRLPRLQEGSPAQCVSELAKQAKRWMDRGYASSEIFIGFDGQPGEMAALRLELAAQNIPLSPLEPEAPSGPLAREIEAIRTARDLPLRERLNRIHQKRREPTAGEPGEWNPPDRENPPGVFFLPPYPVQGPLLLYTGRPSRSPANPWLREEERFTLRQNGFALPTLQARTPNPESFCQGGARLFRPGARTPGPRYQDKRPDPVPVPECAPTRFSPTQLESYTRCPAKYFFGNRLRLETRGRQSKFPLVLGKITHRVLEWARKDNLALSECTQQLLNRALEQEAPDWMGSRWETQVLAQAQRLLGPVDRLESDLRERFPGFSPFAFELDFEFDFSGVRFKGQIDRVDRDRSGRWILYDYKTGNVPFTPKHIADGTHFQALLYWMALEQMWGETGVAMIFYDLKKAETKRGILLAEQGFDGKAMTRGHVLPGHKWQALREAGEERIREVVTNIQKGNFAATPSASICPPCDFRTHCGEAFGDE